MKTFKVTLTRLMILGVIILAGCSDNAAESQTGVISVSVIDTPSSQPVEGVEITIMPGNLTRKTNGEGIAKFVVEAGNYFVDADVCCIGPGFINYHEPVTVTTNQITEIELAACSICD